MIAPANRPASHPLSPGQRRLWFLDTLHPGVPLYNETEAVRLEGELDTEALERALNAVVERHEVLRTTIQVSGGDPMAIVHESWPLHFDRLDWSGLAPADRQAKIDRLLVEEPRRPFDLEHQPGIRAALVRLGDREHILLLMMHHIIWDWHSEGLFWRDLSVFYASFKRGEPAVLPSVAAQYRDYALWQEDPKVRAAVRKDVAYWEEQLRGAPRILEIPADHSRPANPSYRGERERLILDPPLTKALRDLSKKTGATLFTVLAAALNALLYRYTGTGDIPLGIPVADRDRKEFQSALGFLLQTHVLRTRFSGDISFRSLLARLQKRLLALHMHRAAPFDEIVRSLHPDRSLSYSPLFQVMFSWRDRNHSPYFLGLEGLHVTPQYADAGVSKFDLTLYANEQDDHIALEMEFSTDLFERDRITRMLGHYRVLTQAVVENPDCYIDELPLLTTAERNQLLVECNCTAAPYPANRTVNGLVQDQSLRSPDAVAVIFENHGLTYRELNARTARLAEYLRSLGVGPNVLVGICVERSAEMLVGLLGILRAGGAYVPLDPEYPADRLAFIVEDSKPPVILTSRRARTRLPAGSAKFVCLDDLIPHAAPGHEFVPSISQPTDLAYVLYTSGSTGKPKGVRVSNQALVNFLTSMQRQPGMTARDRLLAVTTLSFDIAGLEIFLPLISGARVIIANRETALDGRKLVDLIKTSGATVMQATPATWNLLLESGWTGSPQLKILCGGEAWPNTLAAELLPRCESLWNMYGPTETTIWSAVARVQPGKPVFIGPPIANTTFHVLDARRQLVPIGLPGELYIGGDGVALGYLNRPELTSERFVDDRFSSAPGSKLYRTGDLVRRMTGVAFEFLGRIDQQVKVRGFRIELEEVESVLKQHPAVRHCAASAQGTAGDKVLVGFIVPRGEGIVPSSADLRAFARQHLPDYMVPTSFIITNQLPFTPNGKLDRNALSASTVLPETLEPATAILSPRTATEIALLKIWESVLGIRIRNVRDSFFDLGGHSLLAARLFGRIEDELNVRLPLATLYEAPSIEALATIVDRGTRNTRWRSLVPIQPAGSRPPFFCFHGAGGNVLIYRKLSQHLGPDQPFYGLQAQGLDGISPVLTDIESMAELYLAEIRTIQPKGPYLLGGYCMGGTIAYEVAQQLHAAGDEVALLALFDTVNWHAADFGPWSKFSRAYERLIFHAAAIFELNAEGRRTFLKGKFAELGNRIPVWWGSLSSLGRRPSGAAAFNARLAEIWSTNDEAAQTYRPKPYPAQVTDFRPARQYSALNKPELKWDRLAQGGQRVVVLPGYPAVMLTEPFVKELARTLEKSIDAALSRRDPAASGGAIVAAPLESLSVAGAASQARGSWRSEVTTDVG